MKQVVAITIRLSVADKKKLQDLAQKAGLSVSAYIRTKLLYDKT